MFVISDVSAAFVIEGAPRISLLSLTASRRSFRAAFDKERPS